MSSSTQPESTLAPAPGSAPTSDVKPALTIEDISRLLDSKISTQIATLTLTTSEVKSDMARLRGDVLDRLDGHDRSIADIGRRLTVLESSSTPLVGAAEAYTPPSTTVPPPPTASVPPTNEKVLYCKAERLGEFRGDPLGLEFWIGTVRDVARTNPSRAWQAAVRAAIPSALKGDAREWHVALTDEEVQSMPDLPSYFKAMRANFPVDYITLRKKAYARQWDPTKESALGYSQVKIRMLRQATPEGTPEEMIVNDVLDGLLPSFHQIIRLPRGKGRTVQALKLELGEQEPIWRRIYKVEVQNDGVRTVATLESDAYTHQPLVSPSVFPTDQRRTFRYDPTRVVEAKGDFPRQYRKENGRVLRLTRPCGKCGQSHFDFEHDTLIGKVYSLVETSDYEEVDETQPSGF
ncbi:unnamed protein product [Tilletia caries]|nr:unnamed protein product [Tilletia caries]